jgi:hypothetical protein
MTKWVGLFWLMMAVPTLAQKLSGDVTDALTAEPIPYANVFFNNTSINTQTDSLGRFGFAALPPGEYTLVVRFIGYKVYTQKLTLPAQQTQKLTVKLIPDQTQLAEIKVTSRKDKARLSQLTIFEKQFLGDGVAAKQCKLVNSWVLDFTERDGTLSARASDVLEIDNQYLGYKIRYLLDHFRYNGTEFSYAGYADFSAYFTNNPLEKARWQANRQATFWSSDIHFFNALKNRKAAENKYEAYRDKPGEDPTKRTSFFYQQQRKLLTVVALDSLVSTEPGKAVYQLPVSHRLEIHHSTLDETTPFYKDKPVTVSWLETNGRPVRFNADRVVLNPQDIAFSGYLANRRVAEMLPLNFRTVPAGPNSVLTPKSKWSNWIETPWFTTDRPYYFSRDIVRVSGLMRYGNAAFADSLSSIVHVEVVQPLTKRVVAQQRVRVKNGHFATELNLTDSTATADRYLLRVYTQWMRNFGDSSYAYRWLPILPLNQRFRDVNPADSVDTGKFLLTRTDSALLLKPTDSFGANLLFASVTITPAALQTNAGEAAYQWSAPTLPDSSYVPVFGLEKGIDVTGRMTKPQLRSGGSATVLIPNQQLTYFAGVDETGIFQFQHLPLEGIQPVIVSFTDAKGKAVQQPVVTVDSLTRPVWIPRIPTPAFQPQLVMDTTAPDWLTQGIQIREVLVKAVKPPKPISSLYKTADYTLLGKDLFDRAVGTNILTALQGRVPGITLVEFPDENGFSKLVIRMRGGASAGGFQGAINPQPLVLVDNVPFDNINQLSQIPATLVERIDVVNRAESLLGLRGYVGVISIITRNGLGVQKTENRTSPDLVKTTVRGFAAEPASGRTRDEFIWVPAISTTSVTTVPLPNAKGTYSLVIDGLTTDGKAFRFGKIVVR